MKAKLIKDHADYHLVDDKRFIIGTTVSCTDKQKLSLKNCQAIERGYDLDELAENIKTEDGFAHRQSFKAGFQKALELMGDKKFSEEDIRKAMESMANLLPLSMIDNYIQSLQQTQWDVEIEMWFHGTRHKKGEWIPKLNAEGCLILKPNL